MTKEGILEQVVTPVNTKIDGCGYEESDFINLGFLTISLIQESGTLLLETPEGNVEVNVASLANQI
jgi:hypothetical protein